VKFGRFVRHDKQSRQYAYRPTKDAKARYGNNVGNVLYEYAGPELNQGDIGACTGFALGIALASQGRGNRRSVSNDFCRQRYARATQVDSFRGTWPPDDTGSSGLAVAKAAKRDGILTAYEWCFTTTSLVQALFYHGPVMLGIPWFEGMNEPMDNGEIVPSGSIVGGHEITAIGYVDGRLRLHNSWGRKWGDSGQCWLHLDHWMRLRSLNADVVVPHVVPPTHAR
jgi:hypothetical protein